MAGQIRHTRVALIEACTICSTCCSLRELGTVWKAIPETNPLDKSGSNGMALTCDPLVALRTFSSRSLVGKMIYGICSDFREAVGNDMNSLLAFVSLLCSGAWSLVHCKGFEPFEVAAAFRFACDEALKVFSSKPSASFVVDFTDCSAIQQSLNHFCSSPADGEMMAVAVSAFRHLQKDAICYEGDDHVTIDLGGVLVYRIKGSSSTKILPGILISVADTFQLNNIQAALARRKKLSRNSVKRIALLKNSLTFDARKVGASNNSPGILNPTVVLTPNDLHQFHSEELIQTEKLIQEIRLAEIDLLVCTGITSPSIVCPCAQLLGVIIVSNVQMRELEALSRAFGETVFTDISQLVAFKKQKMRECDSLQGDVTLVEIDKDSSFSTQECSAFLSLDWSRCSANFFLQCPVSVVIYSPLSAYLEAKEALLWSNLNLLRNVHQTKRAVIGNGITETRLANNLRNLDSNLFENIRGFQDGVLCFADCLESLVLEKSLETKENVYQPAELDCYVAKQALLRVATQILHRLLHLQ